MKKALTLVVVVGLGIVLYNQYKKSKETQVKLK